MSKCKTLVAFVAAGCVLVAQPVVALTIDLIYRNPGESIAGVATAGAAPANAVGGGMLQTLVAVAADYWEAIFGDPHSLTLEYGWAPLSSAGTHNLITEGGTPHRESYGTVRFDNDQSFIWYLDSTPHTNTEFGTFTRYTQNLGGGVMEVGREFTGGVGDASRFDLLTTAIHEIGHALGLGSANNAFVAEAGIDRVVNLTSPLPFAGAAIPIESASAHIDLAHALLRDSRPSGVRRFSSEADILVNAQISGFTQINFAAAVPEPCVGGILVATGLTSLLSGRRRKLS